MRWGNLKGMTACEYGGMRHGKMGRHGDTVGHGHGNLLVLLVACRGLGAHHLSVLLKLESLRALVVDLFTWSGSTRPRSRRYAAIRRRRGRALHAPLPALEMMANDPHGSPQVLEVATAAHRPVGSHGPPTCVRTTYPDPRWRPSKDKNGRKRVGEFLRAAAPSIFIRTGKGREAGNAVTGFACPQGDLIKSGERCVSDPSRRRYPLPPIPP